MKGLNPKLTSFSFKLLHDILPTRERLHRVNPTSNPICLVRGCEGFSIEDVEHSISCSGNKGVGKALLETMKSIMPSVSMEQMVRLEVTTDSMSEFPVIWMIVSTMKEIWTQRRKSGTIRPLLIRAQLESEVNLLRSSKFLPYTPRMDNFIVELFNSI